MDMRGIARHTSTTPMTVTEAKRMSLQQQANGEAHTHEEAMSFPAYQKGFFLNQMVLGLWHHNTRIQALGRPFPYCLNSKGDDGSWNFSWKCPADQLFNEPTDRVSMFYTVHPDGSVVCREYPNDKLDVNGLLAVLNLAAVIVSDCSEIPLANLDIQGTAQKLLAAMKDKSII